MVEPIDFEGFIAKNKTLIQNDSHRELLMYPNDDVTVSGDDIKKLVIFEKLIFCIYLSPRKSSYLENCAQILNP